MITQKVVEWHKDRNLIDGTTDQKQVIKMLEEFIELYEACFDFSSPKNLVDNLTHDIEELMDGNRIKITTGDKSKAKKDAIGDMGVVSVNMATRNGWTLYECLEHSYDEIKDRKGKMINGAFVKESDLISKE